MKDSEPRAALIADILKVREKLEERAKLERLVAPGLIGPRRTPDARQEILTALEDGCDGPALTEDALALSRSRLPGLEYGIVPADPRAVRWQDQHDTFYARWRNGPDDYRVVVLDTNRLVLIRLIGTWINIRPKSKLASPRQPLDVPAFRKLLSREARLSCWHVAQGMRGNTFDQQFLRLREDEPEAFHDIQCWYENNGW